MAEFDMAKLTSASASAESTASESNITIRKDDNHGVREVGAGTVIAVPSIVIPMSVISKIFARGVATEKGKELKATITVPRGQLITHDDKAYLGMRLGLNAFAQKVA